MPWGTLDGPVIVPVRLIPRGRVETKPDSISWIRVGRRCEAILELVSDKIGGYFVSTRENRVGFSSNCENVFLSYVYLFFRVEILIKCSSISSGIIMIFKL